MKFRGMKKFWLRKTVPAVLFTGTTGAGTVTTFESLELQLTNAEAARGDILVSGPPVEYRFDG